MNEYYQDKIKHLEDLLDNALKSFLEYEDRIDDAINYINDFSYYIPEDIKEDLLKILRCSNNE